MVSTGNQPDLAWPPATDDAGLEVWYGLTGPRDGRFALWYRYTLLSTRGGMKEARLWGALTYPKHPERSLLMTRRMPLSEVRLGDERFKVELGDAGALTDGSAVGRLDTPAGPLAWDIAWAPDTERFTPLSSPALTELMVRAGAGRHRSVNEAVRMSGTVSLGDEVLELSSAPGHQGHTSSRSLNDSWCWIQCNGFADPSVSLEALSLRGMTTLCLREGGRVHRLNHLSNLVGPWRTKSRQVPGLWHIESVGPGVKVFADIEVSNKRKWQRAAYLSPDGSLRYNAHCSVATVLLEYEVKGGARGRFSSDAGRAEWVARKPPVPGTYLPELWESERAGAMHAEAAA